MAVWNGRGINGPMRTWEEKGRKKARDLNPLLVCPTSHTPQQRSWLTNIKVQGPSRGSRFYFQKVKELMYLFHANLSTASKMKINL